MNTCPLFMNWIVIDIGQLSIQFYFFYMQHMSNYLQKDIPTELKKNRSLLWMMKYFKKLKNHLAISKLFSLCRKSSRINLHFNIHLERNGWSGWTNEPGQGPVETGGESCLCRGKWENDRIIVNWVYRHEVREFRPSSYNRETI